MLERDLHALEWDGAYQKYRRMYARLFKESQENKVLMWLVEIPLQEIIGQVFVMLNSGERDAADGFTRAYVFAFRVKPHWRNKGDWVLSDGLCGKRPMRKRVPLRNLERREGEP